ncbi:MAG: FAD-binding protein [Beijerinckiaceae bacterium]|nr:MAG: FAD-binding protein [Beijerinckiaceae bacterium]
MTARIHVIGAGLAGLAAALRLAPHGREIFIHEAAPQAGGRCRSYFDATLGMVIDNGNHLLLSGNHAAQAFLREIGAEDRLVGPETADFAFIDFANGARWRLRPNDGPIPWWVLSSQRRVPDTRIRDYFAPLALLKAAKGTPIGAAMVCKGTLYERLWRPFFLAALNTEPGEAEASLAATLLRETLMKGGRACRPLVAQPGLSAAFIEPALAWLAAQNVQITFKRRLSNIVFAEGHVARLDFGHESIAIDAADQVVLAVPPVVAVSLVPDLPAPRSFRAIVNAHFKIAPPAGLAPITGIVNGLAEWLFVFPDRLSVTISGADRLLDTPREVLAERIWQDVARVTQIAQPLPTWQIIREIRATFAATPEEEARRPATRTAFPNLFLAGDWTATGLPATIEGSIRSGFRAAAEILCLSRNSI